MKKHIICCIPSILTEPNNQSFVTSHWSFVSCEKNELNYNIMKLEDLVVYKLAMEIGDEVYFMIEKWDNFHKWTTGK